MRKAYEQVADQLYALIVAGELARGERLPSESVLAREFGVSRATVREALRHLAAALRKRWEARPRPPATLRRTARERSLN